MRYKVVIADDEPLVLVGLQSMLDWKEYDISIEGLARNGAQLVELIEAVSPDIVITDIRMPVKSGLEVMREIGERFGRVPLFIILTSHEEYKYVKEALRYQAVDYLVKIELTSDTLAEAIKRSIATLRDLRPEGEVISDIGSDMVPFRDRFFVRLLNGLFESRDQYRSQMEDLGLDLGSGFFYACYCELTGIDTGKYTKERMPDLYSNIVRMIRETAAQRAEIFVVSLDLRCFCVIFRSEEPEIIRDILSHTVTLIHNYFAVDVRCSVGTRVDDLFLVHESFETAREIHALGERTGAIEFFNRQGEETRPRPVFDMASYREDLAHSFQELDFASLANVLDRILSSLGDERSPNGTSHIQAMDASCSVLYMALTLLPDGDEIVSGIFRGEKDGYRSIYDRRTAFDCREWIRTLRDGLVGELQNRRQDYRMRVVSRVQRYINDNIGKRLTLREVASVHGFSQNYLSTLFTKYGGCGFVEFTTNAKIAAAKKLMAGGGLMIHEIAEQLGFESAFYFSKVFKKVEGVSPREYLQHMECGTWSEYDRPTLT